MIKKGIGLFVLAIATYVIITSMPPQHPFFTEPESGSAAFQVHNITFNHQPLPSINPTKPAYIRVQFPLSFTSTQQQQLTTLITTLRKMKAPLFVALGPEYNALYSPDTYEVHAYHQQIQNIQLQFQKHKVKHVNWVYETALFPSRYQRNHDLFYAYNPTLSPIVAISFRTAPRHLLPKRPQLTNLLQRYAELHVISPENTLIFTHVPEMWAKTGYQEREGETFFIQGLLTTP